MRSIPITICLSILIFLEACSSTQNSENIKDEPIFEEDQIVDIISPPTFEEFYPDQVLFDESTPERCLKSYDVNGKECTEEVWRTNLDKICNAEQIDNRFAKLCIWRQFEYCDDLGDNYYYSSVKDEVEISVFNKTDVYNCTNYLMFDEIRSSFEMIRYELY